MCAPPGRGVKDGDQSKQLAKLEALRDILTSEGRSLAQGSICWLWARSPMTIPIPGFKNVNQVTDNAGALNCKPLTDDQMSEVDRLLERTNQP